MLKYFYKTLLVSFLCGSLLLLDFSYKGSILRINSAQAEVLKTDGLQNKDPDLGATLTMTAVGVLASRLYKYKMTTDIMLAAAGGAIFLAGEVVAFMKLDKSIKDMETEIKRDKNGDVDQKQIETLIKLKKSYEDAKDTATMKKNLQMAAAAAFAAAGIMAYTMSTTEVTGLSTCTTGINTGLGAINTMKLTCASLTAGTYTAAQGAQCWTEVELCEAAILPFETALMSHEMTRQATTPSLAALTADTTENSTLAGQAAQMSASCVGMYGAAGAAAGPACTPLFPLELVNDSGGTLMASNDIKFKRNPLFKNIFEKSEPKFVQENSNKKINFKNYFESVMDMMFPKAHAELFSAMGIGIGLAVNILMYLDTAIGPMIDLFMLTPIHRAGVWAALGALTFLATTSTSKQIGKIEENISAIDRIINAMKAHADGVQTGQSISANNGKIDKTISPNKTLGLNGGIEGDVDLKATGSSMPCLTGEKAGKCDSFSNTLKQLPDFKSMPDSMQSQVSSISKMADGLSGTSKISSSTLSEATALASHANALSAELAKKQKELQDKLKASKLKVDLAKNSDKIKNDLDAALQKGLEKYKTTSRDVLASYGSSGGSIGNSASAVATDANKNAKDSKNGKKGSGIAIPVVGLPSATLPKLDDKAMADSLKADADKAAAEAALTADAKATSIDDYELKNDITKDKDSSIFELISNRYQKSGYPRLFKRIK